VMKAWKRFENLSKKFNSKVTPAEGWKFNSSPPRGGRSLSIKNFLFNSGLMSEEGTSAAPRRYKVEIQGIEHRSYSDEPVPSDFYEPKWGDPIKFVLVINGKDYELSKAATEKLYKLRIKGKDFTDWVWGSSYGKPIKVLSLKREGKEVMAWMAEKLPGLPSWVQDALTAASTQTPSKSRGRRY